MINTYIATCVIRHTEQDIYTDGCQPHTSVSYWMNDKVEAQELNELVNLIKKKHKVGNGALLLNSCDEVGRLDVQLYTTENGSTMVSKKLLALWKEAKAVLYLTIFTYHITRLIDVDLSTIDNDF